MKQEVYTIIENKAIADNTFLMRLAGNVSETGAPGRFVNIKLDGFYLRRPISVCDNGDGVLTIIYKAVGEGTAALSAMTAGERLDLLTGLGNGYDITRCGERPVLIGGGVGVPPMYLLCKKLREAGKNVTAILGFNKKSEVFFEDEFRALGAEVIVTTADGSYGERGFVTDALKKINCDYIFTCGPEPMLRAVHASAGIPGQYSFEERMGCGFGACMGCSCRTKYGNKRICKEGPVLDGGEIIW